MSDQKWGVWANDNAPGWCSLTGEPGPEVENWEGDISSAKAVRDRLALRFPEYKYEVLRRVHVESEKSDGGVTYGGIKHFRLGQSVDLPMPADGPGGPPVRVTVTSVDPDEGALTSDEAIMFRGSISHDAVVWEVSSDGVDYSKLPIAGASSPPAYDSRANRLADECMVLRSERNDLLRENAVLRRKVERMERGGRR
jgi:hypothetical protein